MPTIFVCLKNSVNIEYTHGILYTVFGGYKKAETRVVDRVSAKADDEI